MPLIEIFIGITMQQPILTTFFFKLLLLKHIVIEYYLSIEKIG